MKSRLRQFVRNVGIVKRLQGWSGLRALTGSDLGPIVCEAEQWRSGGEVLVLAPHPDDEVFGCGIAIAEHRSRGTEVHVVVLHDGSYGNPSGQRDLAIVQTRQAETTLGLEKLGGAKIDFWPYPDGGLALEEAVSRLREKIKTLSPWRIYTPWFGDNHFDHENTAIALAGAVRGIQDTPEVWQYEVWAPLVPNRLLKYGRFGSKKLEAMQVFKSQLASTDYLEGIVGLNKYRGYMAQLNDAAEAYFASEAQEFVRLVDRYGA